MPAGRPQARRSHPSAVGLLENLVGAAQLTSAASRIAKDVLSAQVHAGPCSPELVRWRQRWVVEPSRPRLSLMCVTSGPMSADPVFG